MESWKSLVHSHSIPRLHRGSVISLLCAILAIICQAKTHTFVFPADLTTSISLSDCEKWTEINVCTCVSIRTAPPFTYDHLEDITAFVVLVAERELTIYEYVCCD